jgi:GNAT superfamily N-acetyltransferase
VTAVRPARAADAEAIVDAHEAAWDATLGVLIGLRLEDLAPREERVARMSAGLAASPDDAAVLVAEADRLITGMGVVRDIGGMSGEVRDLYVIPEAWGTGVASTLLHAMLEWLTQRGATSASLWVAVDNLRARRFYEREGWTLSQEERTSPLGPNEVRYETQTGNIT